MIGTRQAPGRAAVGWQVRFGFNAMVDFSVWALEMDGLSVPPFDRHAEGPGLLRTLGADPETWRAWLHAIVAQQAGRVDLHTAIPRPSLYHSLQAAVAPCLPRRFNPPALWPGHPNLRPWLEELWEQYGPLALERRGTEMQLECTLVEQWLQEALADRDPRSGRLHIHLVRYPGIVAYPVLPDALILGLDVSLADHAALWSAVRAAVPAYAST